MTKQHLRRLTLLYLTLAAGPLIVHADVASKPNFIVVFCDNLGYGDIAPLLFGTAHAKSPYDAFYYYHQDQLQAVRSGPWKMFLPVAATTEHPHFSSTQQPTTLLFNVVEDIACKHNVAAAHPEIVAQLNALANHARRDLGDQGQPGLGQRPIGKAAIASPRRLSAK